MSMLPIPFIPTPTLGFSTGLPVGSVVAYAGILQTTQGQSASWPKASNASDCTPASSSDATTTPPPMQLDNLLAMHGWLLCDGRQLPIANYVELFNVIGYLYSSSKTDQNAFNIPDYRGLFLRGADLSAGIDPDASTRAFPYGIANDNPVGSLQCDALQTHEHQYDDVSSQLPVTQGTDAAASPAAPSKPNLTGTPTSSMTASDNNVRTSTETRPRNVYVNYIIKFRETQNTQVSTFIDPDAMLPAA